MTQAPPLPAGAVLTAAQPEDAPTIAAIHLAARRQALPDLRVAHTDAETRAYFGRVVGDPPRAWWVVRHRGQVAAYMRLTDDDLAHLYVAPGYQGRGFGSGLLAKAKTLSPHRLTLWTFQRNAQARAFYAARGFRAIRYTDGDNEEGEPDVQYEWRPAP